MNDIALCVSLCTCDSQRTFGKQEIFINVISSDTIWTSFGRQKILDIFWTTFLVSIGLRIGEGFRSIRILHLYSGPLLKKNVTLGTHRLYRTFVL